MYEALEQKPLLTALEWNIFLISRHRAASFSFRPFSTPPSIDINISCFFICITWISRDMLFVKKVSLPFSLLHLKRLKREIYNSFPPQATVPDSCLSVACWSSSTFLISWRLSSHSRTWMTWIYMMCIKASQIGILNTLFRIVYVSRRGRNPWCSGGGFYFLFHFSYPSTHRIFLSVQALDGC